MTNPLRLLIFALWTLTGVGCDPVVEVFGTFFPAWSACLACGVALAIMARSVLAWTRLEPHLGPLLLVYPCLGLLFTILTWLALYRS